MGTNATVGVGVIGRGFGKRIVAPVFAATDGCEVIDVVSPRDDDAVQGLFARADVDLVAVHSPPFCHRDLVIGALAAGKAVLCDKPFGTNESDAKAMDAAAATPRERSRCSTSSSVTTPDERLRELVLDGAAGTVEHVQWSALAAGRATRSVGTAGCSTPSAAAAGSAPGDRTPSTSSAGLSARSPTPPPTGTSRCPNDPTATGTCTRAPRRTGSPRGCTPPAVRRSPSTRRTRRGPPCRPRLTVLGSDGALESVGDGRIMLRTLDGTQEVFRYEAPAEDPHLVPMRAWAEVVRDAVRAGAVPDGEATFADGLACARVLDQLRA